MRKALTAICCIALICMLLLPLGALSPAIFVESTYQEYREHLKKGKPVFDSHAPYVEYQQIARLGRFSSYFHYNSLVDCYTYFVIDELSQHWRLDIFPNNNVEQRTGTIGEYGSEISIDRVKDLSHMTQLSEPADKLYSILQIGRLKYHYVDYKHTADINPCLSYISWSHNGNGYVLYLSKSEALPEKGDTEINRFLNYETAEDALVDLIADTEGGFEMSIDEMEYLRSERIKTGWIMTGKIAACAAAVVIVISFPIICIRRRKKKKAAASSGEADDGDAVA